MTNLLTADQKRKLAAAMYGYFGERHPTRTGLKTAYESQNRGSERTFIRKMDHEGAKLSEEEADWVVDQLLTHIEPLPLRTVFLRTVGDEPETFGYSIPEPATSETA